jgi:hypothetical protein
MGGQFTLHSAGHYHFFKQSRKELDMPDQNQVIDGACIGDDQPHSLESQAF